MSIAVQYFHPAMDAEGKRLSTANIIWADRDHGDAYYRVSRFAMRAGRFPANHPCAPFHDPKPNNAGMCGDSDTLIKFRERGYWASCFPEGDGITLKWWDDVPAPVEKTREEVMRDIEECFGWTITNKNGKH